MILSVTFHPGVSSKDLTTALTGDMIFFCQILVNSAKLLLPYRRHYLEKMRHLHANGDLGLIP